MFLHNLPCCGGLQFVFLVTFAAVVLVVNGMSIDEIIVSATGEKSGFDVMSDPSGNTLRHELDMILTTKQYATIMGLSQPRYRSRYRSRRYRRKALKRLTSRWTKKQIPYIISQGVFNSKERGEIKKAINDWETHTCISFRPARSTDKNKVKFDNGGGCYSYVGMTGGTQPIGLAGPCRRKGIIIHEIGHAVGFHHEQNRPDRDGYIIIKKRNIPEKLYYNFKKYPWSEVSTLDVPYDYRSVMHYGGTAFSYNGKITIETKDPAYQNVIGSRTGLSFNDIKLANLMYKCSEKCPRNIRCPRGAFLDKNCKCQCPGEPIKECSGTSTPDRRTTSRPHRTRAPVTRRPTTPAPSVTCSDKNRYCPDWAKAGYCYSSEYVKLYCKSSCGKCSPKTGRTSLVCKDVRRDCRKWRRAGYCTGVYEAFMEQYCPLTCNKCDKLSFNYGWNAAQTITSKTALVLVVLASIVFHF